MWNSLVLNNVFGLDRNVPWFAKRKMEREPTDGDLPPAKQFITEEKMVNQLKGIHLSQDYTTHGNPGPSVPEVDMDDGLATFNEKSSSLPTLVMCDEIRELHKAIESPLPKQLFETYRGPSTALVLWRPPAGELGKYLESLRDTNPKEPTNTDVNMDDDNNNESANQNMNGRLL